MSFFGQLGSFIMTPLYYVISVVLVGFHHVFGAVFGATSGASWALSIIGLTVIIRAALIPLFVKQIKSSRNMQLLQPRVKELQKKYGHDRERLAQETMNLYKETKTNPFSSCLPLLVQMPIFLALFRLINNAAHDTAKGVLTNTDVSHLSNATIFGARIADTFTGAHSLSVQILAGVLVVAMTATTFLTQRQLMSKNMPADALSGPYAQQQKMLLYVLPLVFAIGGIAFPIGVLLYWTTSNLWTMCQQFYVIRNNPAPNTEAFRAKQKRDEEKRRRKGLPLPGTVEAQTDHGKGQKSGKSGTAPAAGSQARETPARPAPRQQPKKQTRAQRRKSGGNAAGRRPPNAQNTDQTSGKPRGDEGVAAP